MNAACTSLFEQLTAKLAQSLHQGSMRAIAPGLEELKKERKDIAMLLDDVPGTDILDPARSQATALLIFADVQGIRSAIEYALDRFHHYSSALGGLVRHYQKIDALSRLFFRLPRSSNEMLVVDVGNYLSVLALILIQSHEVQRFVQIDFPIFTPPPPQSSHDFDQRLFYRMVIGLLHECKAVISEATSASLDILLSLSNFFHVIQPLRCPGFAFAWLELISHRLFLPHLLSHPSGWSSAQSALVLLFRFLAPFLRHAEMTDSVRVLYKGALRVLLLLLHDFPGCFGCGKGGLTAFL